MKGINIEHKLQNRRGKKWDSEQILAEVQQILSEDSKKEEQIAHQLGSKNNVRANDFDFDLLKTEKIFHIDQIKEICIDYRLRFLNSSYFKGKIPQEAISKIKLLETIHNTSLKGFKVMAPSKLFKLEDKDDPLLFAPIGNDYYYLIHKWGNDLHPLRKLFVWPFKNISNLVLVVLLISYFVTLMVPEGLFSKKILRQSFGSSSFYVQMHCVHSNFLWICTGQKL